MEEGIETTEKNVSAVHESIVSLERVVLEMREKHKKVMYKIEVVEQNRDTTLLLASSSKKGNTKTTVKERKDKVAEEDMATIEGGKKATNPNKFKRLDMPISLGENPDAWLSKVKAQVVRRESIGLEDIMKQTQVVEDMEAALRMATMGSGPMGQRKWGTTGPLQESNDATGKKLKKAQKYPTITISILERAQANERSP
ncbi:unnamed protein product [Citrullus colocynthis]|uniref:Gag-pol polyprotein n=1 Tax=Citrullus colocynthis TaxID=252529 RepID=A0ABP0XUQ2_9ROSI